MKQATWHLGVLSGTLLLAGIGLVQTNSLPAYPDLPPPQIAFVRPQPPVIGYPVTIGLRHLSVAAPGMQLQWRWANESGWHAVEGCVLRVQEAPPGKLHVQFRAVDGDGNASRPTDLVLRTVSPSPRVWVASSDPATGPVYGQPFTIHLVAQSPLLRKIDRIEWRYVGQKAWNRLRGTVWRTDRVSVLRLMLEFRSVDETGLASSPLVASWEVSPLMQSLAVSQLLGWRQRIPLHAIALVPGQPMVVFAGESGLLGWFNWETKKLGLLPGHSQEHPVWDVAAITTSDGRHLVLSGSGDGSARIWDLDKREAIHVLPESRGATTAVTFSPDGRFAFLGNELGQCILWETATGQSRGFPISQGSQREPICVLRSWQQGKQVLVAAGTADNFIHIASVLDFKPITSVVLGDNQPIWALAYAHEHLLTGSKTPALRYWHWSAKKGVLVPKLGFSVPAWHPDRWFTDATFTGVEFTPDGQYAVSCDRAGRFILWEVRSGKVERLFWQPRGDIQDDRVGFSDVVVTADGEFAWTVDRDGYLRRWYIGQRSVR